MKAGSSTVIKAFNREVPYTENIYQLLLAGIESASRLNPDILYSQVRRALSEKWSTQTIIDELCECAPEFESKYNELWDRFSPEEEGLIERDDLGELLHLLMMEILCSVPIVTIENNSRLNERFSKAVGRVKEFKQLTAHHEKNVKSSVADSEKLSGKLITIEEATELTGLSLSAVYNMLQRGRIKERGRQRFPTRGGGKVLLDEGELQWYLQHKGKGGRPKDKT